jgi:predicted enzyme related to lactoylglutathione lyase
VLVLSIWFMFDGCRLESTDGRVDSSAMNVERVKYVIWAADMDRAEVEIAGAVIGIHSGGEGKRTWTGISLQVADVIEGGAAVKAAGGTLTREPEPENGEPPHLAMCIDPDGNEFMLTRKRG